MIYDVFGVIVFFAFVAGLIGFIFFACVLIDAVAIWWGERDRRGVGPCACGCGRTVPIGWDGMHGTERRG